MHRLLLRQLRRQQLSTDDPPNKAQWQQFLQHIDRSYREADQDRYTLERSLQISSEEMQSLFETLKRSSATRLSRERARLRSLIDSLPDLIVFKDTNGVCLGCNKAFAEFIGRSEQQLIGSTRLRLPPSDPTEAHADALGHAANAANEQWLRAPDGGEALLETVDTALYDGDGEVIGVIHISHDITKRKQTEIKLAHQARHDSLTGLPNRMLLEELLQHAIDSARRARASFALLFFDLDRFKNVNDTLGHPAGDELLRIVADRLRQGLRDGDLISRLGGDEYVVVVENLSGPQQAAQVADKVLGWLSEPLQLEKREISVSGSIGISIYPNDGDNATTLMKNADTAMYKAKRHGGNGYQFYTPELTEDALRFFALEAALRRAIDGGQLLLHYQPQLDLETGQLVGAEALIRWNHPERGLIGPNDFIPLAEETGLIVAVGAWVLQQACQQLVAWRQAGLRLDEISVNLSPRQIASKNLIHTVSSVIGQSGIRPEMLKLEITETGLMSHAEQAEEFLKRLKALGVSLSIDDFGTGYSSMSYLKHFPVDELKIDRSFIRDLPDDRDDAAITLAIIALGHSLRLDIVAEGVETTAQQEFLKQLHCNRAQGYLYGRPVDADQFQHTWLSRQTAAGDA